MADTTRPELLATVKRYLVEALAARGSGDCPEPAAWDVFFEQYNGILRRFSTRVGYHPDEADELLQEVWLDVVRLLGKFEYDPARGGFRRWLFRIMRSKAADLARRRTEIVSLQQLGQSGPPDTNRSDPATVAHKSFLAETVRTAIESYRAEADPGEWQVFERCKLHGRNSSEVAVELGLTPEAVRKRLQRGLARFREQLTNLIGHISPDEIE